MDSVDVITEDRMEDFMDSLSELNAGTLNWDADFIMVQDTGANDILKMTPRDFHRGLMNDVTSDNTPASSDEVVVLSGGDLRKCTIAQLVAAG